MACRLTRVYWMRWVLNRNYDIAFDLALMQAKQPICYAPEVRLGTIGILKPHGSFNYYVNLSHGNCYFEEPDRTRGSVNLEDPEGGVFSPHGGIVPPRLNKTYQQYPAAETILNAGAAYEAGALTLWGVGLTSGDLDLAVRGKSLSY